MSIDGILLANFLSTLFYSATYPFIHKEVIAVIPDTLIAVNQIINCMSVIVFGWIWNKYSERLFCHYHLYCIFETIFVILVTIFTINTGNIVAYYLLDTLVFAMVTRNVICGGIKLRSIRYKTEETRMRFDNNNNSVAAIATIIGSVIAMIINFSLETMLFMATIGNTIDNIFYIVIFLRTKQSISA